MKESKPYKPLPFREGNTIKRIYEEDFTDPVGNAAKVTKVDYMTKKGKLVENYTLYVKWR